MRIQALDTIVLSKECVEGRHGVNSRKVAIRGALSNSHSMSFASGCQDCFIKVTVPAGTPQYYQGASEKQSLDSELALIITQSYTSLADLLPAWTSGEEPGNSGAAEFRLHQGKRAAQQLQVVREAILNLNSLDDVSNVLRDFLQLCYSTVTGTANVVNLTGMCSKPFSPCKYELHANLKVRILQEME